jgi:hypothetical protein
VETKIPKTETDWLGQCGSTWILIGGLRDAVKNWKGLERMEILSIRCRFPWGAERARRPVSARVAVWVNWTLGGVGDSLPECLVGLGTGR